MVAAVHNIYVEQGATFRMQLIYGHKDGTVDVNGDPTVIPEDLTGCSARLQVRERRQGQVLISATTANGGIYFTDAAAGKFTVEFSDEATDLLTMRRAKYDLEVEYPSGDVVRIIQGAVTINANITQDDVTVDEDDVPQAV